MGDDVHGNHFIASVEKVFGGVAQAKFKEPFDFRELEEFPKDEDVLGVVIGDGFIRQPFEGDLIWIGRAAQEIIVDVRVAPDGDEKEKKRKKSHLGLVGLLR
jgi:hypothetical protein